MADQNFSDVAPESRHDPNGHSPPRTGAQDADEAQAQLAMPLKTEPDVEVMADEPTAHLPGSPSHTALRDLKTEDVDATLSDSIPGLGAPAIAGGPRMAKSDPLAATEGLGDAAPSPSLDGSSVPDKGSAPGVSSTDTPADISLILEIVSSGNPTSTATDAVARVSVPTALDGQSGLPKGADEESDSDIASTVADGAVQHAVDSDSSSSDSDSSSDLSVVPQRQNQRRPPPPSDDEDEPVAGLTAAATAHEITQPPVKMPDITEVGPDEELVRIGEVMSVIDSVVVIKGIPRSDFDARGAVLDTDTLLVFEDRKVLGQVFETFGPLKQPLYSVRFPDSKSVDLNKVTVARAVYHVPHRSYYVEPNALNAKGSDASNYYDEEPGDEELEFSDDEQEAAYRRAIKAGRRREQQSARPGPSASTDYDPTEPTRAQPLPYDDDPYAIVEPDLSSLREDDGPSLSMRPEYNQSRGRGRGRGRSRGRGGGDSARGRGRGAGRQNNRDQHAPYPRRPPSHAEPQQRSPPAPDAIALAIANATGHWGSEFNPSLPSSRPVFNSTPYSPAYNPAAPMSGFYQPQHAPPAQYAFNPQHQQQAYPFVAPHINPRFAAQYGFPQALYGGAPQNFAAPAAHGFPGAPTGPFQAAQTPQHSAGNAFAPHAPAQPPTNSEHGSG